MVTPRLSGSPHLPGDELHGALWRLERSRVNVLASVTARACAAGERMEARGLDTPNVTGKVLCGRCLPNTHSYTFTLRWNVCVSESGTTHTRQGEWASSASSLVHILAKTTQVQEPPGAHEIKEVGRSVHICTHTYGGGEQRRTGWRSGGTNGTRGPFTRDPRKSEEVQGNPHGLCLIGFRRRLRNTVHLCRPEGRLTTPAELSYILAVPIAAAALISVLILARPIRPKPVTIERASRRSD